MINASSLYVKKNHLEDHLQAWREKYAFIRIQVCLCKELDSSDLGPKK